MATRLIVFDVDSLIKLMTHYSEGEIPKDSEILNFSVSPKLPRYISLMVRSSEWPVADDMWEHMPGELHPYHFRYEGKRTMKWAKQGDDPSWTDEGAVEAPKRL